MHTPALELRALLVGPDARESVPFMDGYASKAGTVESQTGDACPLGEKGSRCELDRIAAEVGVADDVKVLAKPICCVIAGRKLARGKELGFIAASSIYAACRESGVPVTLKELASASHSTPRELGRIYMLILEKMEIRPPSPNGRSYIAKVASRIHASDDVAELSQEFENRAVKAGLGGRNPMSLAAAALYTASLASGEPVTQSDLAEAAGVSVMSLRETAKWIRTLLKARQEGLSEFIRFATYLASLLGVVAAVLLSVPVFS